MVAASLFHNSPLRPLRLPNHSFFRGKPMSLDPHLPSCTSSKRKCLVVAVHASLPWVSAAMSTATLGHPGHSISNVTLAGLLKTWQRCDFELDWFGNRMYTQYLPVRVHEVWVYLACLPSLITWIGSRDDFLNKHHHQHETKG